MIEKKNIFRAGGPGSPWIRCCGYLQNFDHVLADHLEDAVQRAPQVLLLQVARQRLQVEGASVCPG